MNLPIRLLITLLALLSLGFGSAVPSVLVRPDRGGDAFSQSPTGLVEAVYETARFAAVRIETGNGGVGSGFFITDDGLVMTAHHVVEGATSLTVVTWNGERLPADVVGFDEFEDVAVLAVELTEATYLPISFDRSPSPGQYLLAIGNSRGDFIAPRVGRVLEIEQDVAPYLPGRLLVSDMPLAPGDSGGPVLGEDGTVVGVAVAIGRGPAGFTSLVSPLYGEAAKAAVEELVAGERRNIPFLGISWLELTPELARQAGVRPSFGILITRVLPDTAAHAAGLRGGSLERRQVLRNGQPVVETVPVGGDVITHVDGTRIRSAEDFARAMRTKEVGDLVVLTVDRQGEVVRLEATLGVRNV